MTSAIWKHVVPKCQRLVCATKSPTTRPDGRCPEFLAGAFQRGPLRVLTARGRHGLRRRLASGGGVSGERHQNPDRHPRLQLRREGGACIPSGAFRHGSTTSSTPEPVGRISHVSPIHPRQSTSPGDGLAEESTYRFFLTLCLSCLNLSDRLAYTRRSYHERVHADQDRHRGSPRH